MALGRAIRAAQLFTYIGQAGAEETIGDVYKYRQSLPGGCYSAGALAFLGGAYRWIDDKSKYGVHRFYAAVDPGSDVAQAKSSEIVDFMREMGVDPALFSEMTKAGRNEINILPADRLRHLGISTPVFAAAAFAALLAASISFKADSNSECASVLIFSISSLVLLSF
jgi:hypothetical protein